MTSKVEQPVSSESEAIAGEVVLIVPAHALVPTRAASAESGR